MTLLPQLRDKARVVRRITNPAGSPALTATAAVASIFPASLTHPTQAPSGEDESPRDKPTPTMRWATGYRAPQGAALRAGDRVEVGGVTYELLAAPRPVRAGPRASGYEVPVQNIAILYPFTASIKRQDGTVVTSTVIVAVWGGSDSQQAEGRYEDREGEAPIEHQAALQQDNVYIELTDGQKLRVTSAVIDTAGPRVKLNLRRAGG